MDAGDVTWMLVSSALVLFMVPGLALFYGGMVRSKNVLNMLSMNVYCLGIVPVLWVLFVFSIASSGGGDLIGNFDAAGLDDIRGFDLIPVFFSMTFAAITPALISGAVADRMKFSAWAVFVPVWLVLVYAPVFFWVYSGWIIDMGALDFAGGTAIHINAGVAALAAVLVLGKRQNWPAEAMPPHNLPLVLLGTGILWFGWFGFNAGSALGANEQAVQAFMNTFLAGAAGMIAWLAVEWWKDGHPTTLGAASGVVAALVAITPAAGFVGGLASIVFGAVAGVVCFLAIRLKFRFGYDDSLDVVGVHLVGGILGGVLLGFFADGSAIPGAEYPDGVFFGGGELLLDQVVSIVVVLAYSFAITFVIAKVLDATMGIRASAEDETVGLDQTQHAETAYIFQGGSFDRIR
ncbi:MAG: ammonium transporter [Acidimicrobiales bacterium]|nr:ammonium transporter [Acidimicrobiales bacterium]